MKNYISASKLNSHGSPISALGKGIIIIGRIVLCLNFSVLLVYLLFFTETGGASGVFLSFGLVGWFFLEIIGSIAFHIGQIGIK